MVEMSQIEALSQQIAEQFHPERIILFGSYAYGEPNEDSDVDLLVVMPFDGHPARKAAEIHFQVSPQFPFDLLSAHP
jgi:predicted nucleotidyltransferase